MDPRADQQVPPAGLVGVGASAGGLESLRLLLAQLPTDAGLCFVLLQHMAPAHRSVLAEILRPHSRMVVREAADGDLPQADTVLVTPNNAHIRFDGQILRLSEPDPHSLPRPSINLFFESLALHMGPRAAGIILSGTGSDGAHGLQRIRDAGGLVMVESADSARYSGMPEAAERNVGPHRRMSFAAMGRALSLWAAAPPGVPLSMADILAASDRVDDELLLTALPIDVGTDLSELFQVVRRHCGINLADYKEPTLRRRLARRMQAVGVDALPAYLARLSADSAEIDALARETLISVTSFWRNPLAFEHLVEQVGRVLARKSTGEPVRVWVAGCATGEEAYSVSMVWRDVLGERLADHPLQIFATDLDLEAMQLARRGVYEAEAMGALPDRLRALHFHPLGPHVEIDKVLRESIVFSRHDLTRDPPFPRLDMISCRNVLIYLKPEAQARVMRMFHFALRPGGLLMLGQNESVLNHEDLFRSLDSEVRLYERRAGRAMPSRLAMIDPEAAMAPPASSPARAVPVPAGGRTSAAAIDIELALLRQGARLYLPPCVLLDERLRVLQVHGDVSPFLQLRAGGQTFDVLSLARPEVETELRLLCALLGDGSQDTHQSELVLLQQRRRQRWQMILHAFSFSGREAGGASTRLVLLAFVPVRARGARRITPAESGAAEAAELADARARMKSLIEQLESFNEEMQALNEEAQATNEELQASNEELESANEELQATNQELATVNAELNHQWRRHQQLAEELQSIQNSITMPMLVIDEKFLINRYNLAAERLFRLSPGATGLPLSTMYRPSGIPDLVATVAQAQASASPLSLDLPPGEDGREYVLHLSHNLLGGERRGVVLTVVDNTDLARAERQTRQIEQRLLSVLSHGRALMAIKDTSGRYQFANSQYAEFFALDANALIGRTDAQVLPAEVATVLRQADLGLLRDGLSTELEQSFVVAGQRRWWWSTRFGLYDATGTLEAIGMQAVDLTLARQADESLRIADKVFEDSSEGLMILDAAGRIERVNAALCQLCGRSEAELLGRPADFLDGGRNAEHFLRNLLDQVHQQGRWQGEVWGGRADGSMSTCWMSASPLADETGQISHVVVALTDISDLTRTREAMRHQATHDALTALPNRSLLMDRVGHAIDNARRQRTEAALCFIDLDHFKTVNDSLGHDAGDEVLKLAAQRIGDCIRSCDTLARLGGDEFVLLLENTTRHECLVTVERIQLVLAEPMPFRGALLSTGASVGVALFPGDASDAATLLSHADAAMYRAKNAGRGRYEFYASEVGSSARQRLHIESGLRQALGRNELVLHYQPQVDLRTGIVHGVEALLRWSPAGVLIAPTVFLPIAEESSLIDRIGDWVIDQACRQLAEWRSQGHVELCMSVNLAARQMRDTGLPDRLQQLLIAHGVPGERLVLEITESALLRRDEALDRVLRRIEVLGVQLSLDDFGTGYSSLALLRHLPIRELKIDRSFVQGMADQRDDREIVDAVIGLGRALGLRLVAEGVETEVLQACLRERGPNLLVQGFLHGRPMPADECGRWLASAAMLEGA
ncbi:MAG: hypothetical protein RLZZ592_2113 [Pseudomonadota bacterium]|jgi:two-component system CheB/CheR fusion protein